MWAALATNCYHFYLNYNPERKKKLSTISTSLTILASCCLGIASLEYRYKNLLMLDDASLSRISKS